MKAVNNYLKNVMKSVAYAAADISEEYTPGLHEFTSTNKEFATATYAALKNPTQFVQKQVQAIQESKVYKALDYGIRNAAEDLRTGNFYNKERKERDELALSGLDANWDDLSEFGIDDDWEKNLDSSSSKNDEVTAGDMKIVQSIEGSNAALASATVNAVIATSQNEIKNSRANMAMIYTQNERLFGGLHKDMTILGSTMEQMYKLQSASLQNIDKNMSSFFTQESKLNTERNAILKEMLEMQRNMYKSASDKEKETAAKRKSNRIRWSDINTNGIVNLDAYFNAVKKNINNQLATVMPASFGEDGNMLAVMMTSPLEGVMKYVVNGVIPATVKAAAKEFDASVSGIFGNVIGELGNARSKNEGGLLGTIAKFLGISTSVNRSIDTSRYEKGPVPFDGITRKAIIDVIPTHLRRIEAVLTGRPEEMFDYKAGRWVKVSNVKKQFDDIKKNAVKRATSDLREAMNPGIQTIRKGITSKSERDDFDEAIEQFEQFLYDNNGRFNPKVSASKNGITSYEYPKLYKHYSKIRTVFSDFDRIESTDRYGRKTTRNTRNSIRMRLSNSVLDAKDYEERQYRDIESDVGNVLQSIFGVDLKGIDSHGKYDKPNNNKFEAFNILKNTTDNLGNTIFDYLQNINKELIWFRKNGIPGVGIGSGGSEKVSMEAIQSELDKKKSNINNYAKQNAENERIRKSALDAIASGKAIDLRDFSENEQAYLLRLSSMLSSGAISDYKSEIRGYNSNELSSFMDKHFYKTNIKSMKDIEEAIKKADKEGKNTNEVNMDANEEKFFQKIMNRIGAGGSIFSGIVGASAESFTNLLYTADKAIYEMMYKTEIEDSDKTKYTGFLDAMVGKMSDKFKELGDMFKKNVIDPFKERLGIDENFTDRFKTGLKNTGSRLWTAFKDANTSVYGPVIDKFKTESVVNDIVEDIKVTRQKEQIAKNLKTKYNKKKLDIYKNDHLASKWVRDARTGTLASGKNSEILELGKEYGFYSDNEHELEDKLLSAKLISEEKLDKIRNSFYKNDEFDFDGYRAALTKTYLRYIDRNHAKGTPSGRPFSGLTTLTKGEGLISGRGVGIVPKTGVYNVTTPTHIINTEDMHSITGGPKVTVQQALGREKLAAKAAGFNIASHAAGTNNDIKTKELLEEAKKFIPEAASGGLIGAIISTVLGIAGGPILGAAVGAGSSILASSDTLKNKLFGEAGEDGKRSGGIVSKTIMDKFNKYFPDMAKYGLAGIIPGLITPLGPIGGLMAGAAFGFLKNNERFTNKYFGEEGALHIKSDQKKIIEDMLPGALKGAGVGAVVSVLFGGPFGLVGNAALGSALGLMASTEEFKNGILGQEIDGERVGGIVNEFKDALAPLKDSMKDLGDKLIEVFDKNIIDPIARFITPAIYAIPQVASIIPRKINEYFKEKEFGKNIEAFFRDHVTAPIQGLVTKFLTPVAKTVTSVITSPVRLLGLAGDKIRERQIRTNNAGYMTARERIEFMINKGKGKDISGLDQALANIGTEGGLSVDEAKQTAKTIREITDSRKEIYKQRHTQERKINTILDNFKTEDGKKLSAKAKKKIREELQNNNMYTMDGVRQVLSKYALEGSDHGLTKGQIDNLLEGDYGLGNELKQFMNIKDRETAIKNMTAADRERLKGSLNKELLTKLGVQVRDDGTISDHELAKVANYLETEVLDREANNTGKGEVALDTENNKLFKEMTVNLEDINNILKAALLGNTDALKDLKDKHEREYKESIKNLEAEFNFRDKNNAGYIGEEEFNQYSPEAKAHLSAYSKGVFQKNKATAANKSRGLIKKYKMTAEEVNASKGNVQILAEIMDLGYRIDPKDIPWYNAQSVTNRKIIIKYLSNIYVKRVLSKRPLTKEDLEYAISANLKAVDNHCEYVFKLLRTKKQFNTIQEVMDYQGDRSGEGLDDPVRAESFGQKLKRGAKGAFNFIFNGAEGFDKEEEDKPDIEPHGLGTILLGAGKSILGGAGSLIGSLFKKKDKGTETDAKKTGLLANLFGAKPSGFFDGHNASAGNTDEVDKAGDGKDVIHVGNGEFIKAERDSSGNIEPDTADSKTKTIMNKLAFKEKLSLKLQEAQLKATEIIKNNFDTSNIKGSNKGKLGWLSMLLMGGLLWKSGIIQKLFDGFIKPIWTDHIKPWISETAVPWLKDMWTDHVKPFLTDTVPSLIIKAAPVIGETVGRIIGGVIKELPTLIASAVKTALGWGDEATDNKTNVGATTEINTNKLVETYGSDYVTGIYDENGKALTAGDLANGNYNKIYNSEGVEGYIDSNGNPAFDDQSFRGSSYALTVGHAAGRQVLQSATGIGPGAKITKKVLAGVNKLAGSKNILGKVVGRTGQLLFKPLEAAQKIGNKLNKKLFAEAAEDVTKATAKNGGFMSKLVTKFGNMVTELFSNGTFMKKLSDVAETLGVTNVTEWVNKFKGTIDDIIRETAEGGVKKVSTNVCKKALSKVFSIVTVIADFLTGCDEAESILGVLDTTLVEELVAGLTRALCNFTIILSIWPGEAKIAQKIYSFFDKDLEERQAEATAAYEKYKNETGSTLSQTEWQSQDKSFVGKIKGWGSRTFNNIASFFTGDDKKPNNGIETNTTDISTIAANAGGTVSVSTGFTSGGVLSGLFSGTMLGDLTGDFNFNNLNRTMAKAQEGKISVFSKEYWKMPNDTGNTFKSSLERAYTMLSKLINVPVLMVKGALDGLSQDIETVGATLSGYVSTGSKSTRTTSTSSNTTTTKTTFGSKLKNLFTSGINNIKDFFGFGTGDYTYGTGMYSKQIDPSIAGIRFNASGDREYQTIGNSGCGPAAAVNALESMYGRGNDVLSAAKYAISRGYKEQDGGTKPGFFADYFNRNGYGSQTSFNRSDIERNINNGMPTVIMGRDPKGTSSSTPFGKTPHYVTVTGTDGRGNAIVQDPESRYDNQLYPLKSLMKNTSLGVSAYGKKHKPKRNRGGFGKFGRGKWGRGKSSIVFIGDSRGEMLKGAIGTTEAAKHVWAVKGAMGFKWMRDTGVPSIESQIDSNKAVVIMMGVNDLLHPDWYTDYADYINAKAEDWTSRGADVYYVSVLPVGPGNYVTRYGRITNDTINTWNTNIQTVLSNKVKYMDVSGKLGDKITTIDNVHYPHSVSKLIYQCILDTVTGKDTSTLSTNASTSNSLYSANTNPSILNKFSSIIIKSRAGQALTKLTGSSGEGKYGRGKWGRGKYDANIWWYLKNKMGLTDAGAAGLMGNMYHESGLEPANVENTLESYYGMNDKQYTKAVDDGTISKQQFLHPKGGNTQYGYGLVQWTYPTIKEELYDYAKSKKTSIGDLAMQLECLDSQFNKNYTGVVNTLKTTNDVGEASDKVLLDFERPANKYAKVGTRRGTSQGYYDKYKGTPGTPISGYSGTLPGSASNAATSIIGKLANIFNNSRAGKALNYIIGGSNSESSDSGNNYNGYNPNSTDAQNMVAIAKGELGTKGGDKYRKWLTGRADGAAWCATFVSWVAEQAGVSPDIIKRDGCCTPIYQPISKYGGDVEDSEAKPGDLIFFTDNGQKNRSGTYHIGIVANNDGNKITTVEGNSSNAVQSNSYPTNSVGHYIARPKYAKGGNGVKPLSRFGQFRDSIYGEGSTSGRKMHKTANGYVVVQKPLEDIKMAEVEKRNSRKYVYNKNDIALYGKGTGPDYSKLINSIISILMTIADNTDKLNLIVSILNNKLGTGITASDVSNATTDSQSLKSKLAYALNGINSNTSKFNTYADTIGDSSINSIISAMNAIASE